MRLQSGGRHPVYWNYPVGGHVEGKAALWIRQNNSSGGVLFHNHPGGTRGYCDLQTRTLLPKNATLRVVPPADAIAVKEMAQSQLKNYIGDMKIPKLPQNKMPTRPQRVRR
jgi:SCP1.201-like deaminase